MTAKDKQQVKPTEQQVEKNGKRHSKTWLAFQKAIKEPLVEIVDMRAVLK